jgi:hypothetical protein
MKTVREQDKVFVTMPGIGMSGSEYVTVTDTAGWPSRPVTGEAATDTLEEPPQEFVPLPTPGALRSSARA